FSLLLSRPPSSPTSTLFPYTTLFRSLPSGQGPFTAAILIAGSGPHDRDENVAGHRPLLVLADHLTRKGIAALRYDKRGIGKSAGDRKSTRLNSSHLGISYAVFCLKKK